MKRVQKKSGLEEFLLLKYFHALFPNNIPRATVFDREESIITMEYADSPTFYELMVSGKLSEEDLRGALAFLAKLQGNVANMNGKGILAIDDLVGKDSSYFTNRAIELFAKNFLNNDDREKFCGNYWPINDVLINAPRAYYKDCNLKNACGGTVFLDFENPRFLPPQVDLVNLLEFGVEYLSEKQIRQMLNFYINESEKAAKSRISKDEFLRIYDYAAAHRHLELAGYRLRDLKSYQESDDKETLLFHAKKAKFYLQRLLETNKEREKDCIENLINIIDAGVLKNKDFNIKAVNDKPGVRRVRSPKSFIIGIAGAFSIALASLGIFGFSQVEQRNVPEINKALFSNKNEIGLIKRTEEVIDGTLDVKYELYLTDKNYAERFGTVSNDCVSWSEDGNKVLFVEKRAYTVYDFRSGEKKPLSLRFDYGTCPVFFYGTSVVWNAVEMLFFNIEDSSIGKLVGDTNSFNELKGVIEKKIKTGNNEFSERILSPDGKKLAYLCGNQLCVEDGKTSLSINGKSKIWRFAWSRDSSGIFYFYSRREKFGEKEFPVMNVSFFDLHNKIETPLTFNEYPIIKGFLNTKGVEYIIKSD